ncbi:MAG TPA: ABC transporter substrate-binding protein [Candidatus Binatia bacterium]|jgi:phospholipid transport system substrate-binding protein
MINSLRGICTQRVFGASLGMFALMLLGAPFAFAGSAREQVQSAIEKATAILNDPSLKSDAKKNERIERLRQVIFPKFDFAEMAKRSLGAHWQRRTPSEQQEFVKLFQEMIENSYMSNIDAYNGEKVNIVGEKQEKDFAQVNTKIVNNKGEEFSVDYRLLLSGGDWKVYDVVIENISVVNNYRSQFNRVIAKTSFEDLLQKLRDRQFSAPGKQKT